MAMRIRNSCHSSTLEVEAISCRNIINKSADITQDESGKAASNIMNISRPWFQSLHFLGIMEEVRRCLPSSKTWLSEMSKKACAQWVVGSHLGSLILPQFHRYWPLGGCCLCVVQRDFFQEQQQQQKTVIWHPLAKETELETATKCWRWGVRSMVMSLS